MTREQMLGPPHFASDNVFRASLTDVAFWRPYVDCVLNRHGLGGPGAVTAGVGGTYPTFLCGGLVIKFFGRRRVWSASFKAERAGLRAVSNQPKISAPALIAEGVLFDQDDEAWPYLVMSLMSGQAWHVAGLTRDEKRRVAADLGRQLRRLHRLPTDGIALPVDWGAYSPQSAARQSSFPAHLIDQIDGFLAEMGPLREAAVHADLMERHVFVEGGRLAGIIDWGDALVMDPHYELAKLHLDLFDCRPDLLGTFLSAYQWRVDANFAHKAMALAIIRHAHCTLQHGSCDVFYKLPGLFHLADFATLEHLASRVFAFDKYPELLL